MVTYPPDRSRALNVRIRAGGALASMALGVAVLGLAACGEGGTAAPPSTATETTGADTSPVTATTIEDAPAPTATTTTLSPGARRSSTSSTAVPTTVAPPPTGPPIVTYAADIGVLAPVTVAAPVRVQLGSLGIDGGVIPVGVNAADQLDVPPDAKTLVWYQYGPSPGEPGSAVIAGHLDWKGVLGTFNTLAETPVGASVTVDYDDGTQRNFTVTGVELVDKPAVAVDGTFAKEGESLLRLVTCGGEFNDAINSYYSNVIVTAVPA